MNRGNTYDVSILVVVDWSRQQLESQFFRWLDDVSILVVVDWSRQRDRRRWRTAREHPVSILVVVDWSRQLGSPGGPAFQSSAFQSLLSWIGRVNSDCWDLYYQDSMLFQSLLSWIGRVNSSRLPRMLDEVSRFQSLLSWIGRVNRARERIQTSTSISFNPCCRGLVASTIRLRWHNRDS